MEELKYFQNLDHIFLEKILILGENIIFIKNII
jgi:hypothetical protein